MVVRTNRRTWRAPVVIAAAMLGACAPLDERPAPVEDRSVGTARTAPVASALAVVPEYEVRRGDTLYGIAFRHGLDYRDLARWNGIVDPYVIHPGQRIRLGPPGVGPVAGGARPAASAATATETGRVQPIREPEPARVEPLPDRPIPRENRDAVNPVAAARAGADPSTDPSAGAGRAGPATTGPVGSVAAAPGEGVRGTATAAAATGTPTPGPTAPAAGSPAAPPATPAGASGAPAFVAGGAERTVEGIRWRWPAEGRIINGFVADDPTRQGVDIMGTEGQPVIAAADGEVVYSGSGLIGYGELIIIKHSDSLLSAYGHNRRRLVEEGARVRAGQVIAEMGRSGGSVPMLHFEIRRNGRPIDPRGFLPPR